MAKVLITGASGFIGYHVTKYFLKKGDTVFAFYRNESSLNILNHPQLICKKFVIKSTNDLSFLNSEGVDCLVHLAWENVKDINNDSHVVQSIPNHLNFIKNAVKQLNIKNVFLLGSCFEYGLVSGCINENIKACPVTKYGLAKYKLGQKLLKLSAKLNFNYTHGRLFYVYGDNQKNTIYSQLMNSINDNENEFKMSSGTQKLDYLNVIDVAEIIFKLTRNTNESGFVNICSGKPIELWKLVSSWIEEKNSDIKLIRGALANREHEPKSFWGDTKLLMKKIVILS